MSVPVVTQSRLKDLLIYNPSSGLFTWKYPQGRAKLKPFAGTVKHGGYICIVIDRRHYYAHRLAWLYVHGKFPERELDHIDCDSSNNRITNLREATHSENQRNIRVQRNSGSKIKGVTHNGHRWCAHIWQDGKKRHLGTFHTKGEAELVAKATREELHGTFTNHG